MDPKTFRSKLGGVIAFPVTPFKADLSLDIPGLRQNLKALVKHKLCAVVAAGGTGELYRSRRRASRGREGDRRGVGGACPVIAGVGFNRQIAIDLATESEMAGVDAILALPPYYPNADDEALLEYYAAIGQSTKLGFLVYSRDWVNPTPAWVQKLADAVRTSSRGRTARATRAATADHAEAGRPAVLDRRGRRRQRPAYYSIGIRTYTSSIATVSPKLSIELHEVAARATRRR